MAKRTIEWTRVNNDINGNPRHVCHYLAFMGPNDTGDIGSRYELALSRAAKLGGRKFNNKQYGGGIVFQEYGGSCLEELNKKIFALAGVTDFVATPRRATVICKFIPCTGNPGSDNRYCVTIREFPRRYYNASLAENLGIHSFDQAEYFAQLRIKELGLEWEIQAAGALPTGESVFIV